MAGKSKKVKVVPLVSRDENGKITFTYYKQKSTNNKEKLELSKYNPVTRKHEKFLEGKSK